MAIEHTYVSHSIKDDDDYILSIIHIYEDFKESVEVSGVPVWVLCYYEGLSDIYTNNTDDDRHNL